ncbi:AAC-rich mRNA clone aac4 protein-like [Plakobranchus ocellatus]|uniref:AAC-rich mRNA clone aac4 protein-like n=1 Tax=Plakobranchus ocellatus TaxID=259542 RepID=A0AAV4B023_9GAST|nr:AAC-rich mRNA clone aac4 protein-like [Plakobranchus ocellatus]
MPSLVNNDSIAGVVVTKFVAVKELRRMHLTVGGHRLLTVPNAGGSSVISEVLSFEVLNRCFCAKLKKTEMEVSYFPLGGSITDYTCEMYQCTVAVSVTRAMKYNGEFCLEDAQRLLNKKLKGVIQSTRNSLDKWRKQILHVWSTSHHVTEILVQAYNTVESDVKANTVVMITTAENADYIFNNG